jgi:hypothetical protein
MLDFYVSFINPRWFKKIDLKLPGKCGDVLFAAILAATKEILSLFGKGPKNVVGLLDNTVNIVETLLEIPNWHQ